MIGSFVRRPSPPPASRPPARPPQLGGWSTLLYPCPWINLKRCKDGYRVLGTATIKLADLVSRPPGAAVKVPIVSRFGSKHGFLCFTASDGLCPIEFRCARCARCAHAMHAANQPGYACAVRAACCDSSEACGDGVQGMGASIPAN